MISNRSFLIYSRQNFCRDFLIYIFWGSFQINLNFEYNLLHLLHNVRKGSTVIAGYEYSYGGVKLKVWGSDGNGYAYVGNLVYRVTGSSFVFESGLFGEGVVSSNGICYHLKDHLGSIRAIVDGSGRLLEENDYYAFGHRHSRSEQVQSSANRFKYNGKELQTVGGLGYLDYGARMYDQSLGRWFTTDPLSEKYYGLSPYVYCGNNPLRYVDPDGREVRGITKQDAQNFRNDIYKVLADDKFANVRTLIDIKGKTFKSIDAGKLSSAMEGLTLTDDESVYITMITGAINSKDVYTVEYVSEEYTSSEGAKAFVNHMNKELGEGIGDKMVTPDGKLSSAWIRNSGDGLNVPTQNGPHSFIGGSLQGSERAVTSGHEVFGHGIPAAKKLKPAENNANAIRTDNLIRRILGLPQRDGSNHGGYKEGHVINPYILPILK